MLLLYLFLQLLDLKRFLWRYLCLHLLRYWVEMRILRCRLELWSHWLALSFRVSSALYCLCAVLLKEWVIVRRWFSAYWNVFYNAFKSLHSSTLRLTLLAARSCLLLRIFNSLICKRMHWAIFKLTASEGWAEKASLVMGYLLVSSSML